MSSVFAFSDYRKYLSKELGEGQRNGRRQRLADFLGCQAAHLSQVLSDKNHLSIEHSFGVSRFLGHGEDESEYFLLLVQTARAGTKEAESYFKKKAQEIKKKSLNIKNKITSEKRELNSEEQAIYYGDGNFALAHVAASLPQIKTFEDLRLFLDMDQNTLIRVLEFLTRTGIIARQGDQITTGPGHTHLGADSPHLKKHHLNLRLAALRKVEKGLRPTDIHYGTYYSLSRQDAFLLKEKILDLIAQNLKIIGPSEPEVVYCNIVDFFEITGNPPAGL